MKIVRQIAEPNFYEFAKANLPPSLVAICTGIGYGYYYGIYPKDGKPGFFKSGTLIAEISEYNRTIKLFHTNYFSDIEDLVRKYEAQTGYEMELMYWQSPKDKPLKRSKSAA